MKPKDENAFSRRTFIAGAGVVSALSLAPGCRSAVEEAPPPPAAADTDFELHEITAARLREGLESGRWTARSLAETYLKRIEALNQQGPELRAVIETNPDALRIAEELDRERSEGKVRGPLHGLPVLLKDNLDTADRMKTSAGSLALAESIAPKDSFVARRLREAGAVLLGKTNLSEWANFRSTRSSSGWSARGGQCRNPYVLDRNPCGSSSGSGVAVSANLCAMAVGTETDGSIVCPCHANGVVGIKPTVGLVSRSGIIPISHTQDTAGPMARTVADAALLLGAMTGVDPADPATAASSGNLRSDYTRFLDPDGLRGARIGVARQFFGISPAVDALMETALDVLRRQGATLIDPVEIPGEKELGDPEFEVLLYEFKADLNAYLASLGESAPAKSLKDLIAFNERNADREMPYFGQEIFLRAESKGPLDSREYLEALETCRRLSRREGIDAAMDRHTLDAIFAPTGGPAWPTDPVNGDHYLGGSSTLAAVAGYPAVTVPAGFVHGLPVGVSFFGRAWTEPTLIRIAHAFERTAQARVAPKFQPTLG